jgi:hypothetical protein
LIEAPITSGATSARAHGGDQPPAMMAAMRQATIELI